MRHFLTATLFIIYFAAINGQDWTRVSDDWHFEAEMGKEPVSAQDTYKRIAGSPFLNDDFIEGSLITKDSILYPDIPLRYDIYRDEMEFMVEGESVPRVIATPQNFLFFRLDEKTFVHIAFLDGNTPKRGYFELLNRGECQVLMRRRTDYAEPEGARGFDPAKPARFVQKRNSYFMRFNNQVPEEIRLRRRNILSSFDEKKDEISGFVNENNLSYRSLDDLIKMADYYNQLTKN
ncbi:MAG: hypothetical protein ACLFQA_07150 [Bacteroidales bacterium]